MAVVMVAALVVTACSGDDDAMSASEEVADAGGEMTAESAASEDGDSMEPAAADRGAVGAATEGTAGTDFDLGVIGRDVIVEMRVVLGSDDIQRTVASVMAAASTLGGGVASSDVNYADAGQFGSEGFAVLVVKVPPGAIDRLIDGLDDTATVRSIGQSAQDVTEQLVDLDVRIRNARESVDNVRGFMERTENLDELVSLEAELTRRQTELERLEAQQRNLSDRVALSTVTIEIVPNATLPEPVVEEDTSIADAFADGWDAFTAVLFGLAFVLAASASFLVAGLLVALLAWLVVRRRDRADADAATPRAGPSGGGRGDLDDGDDGDGADDGDGGRPLPDPDREPVLSG